jgi:hypothetical protein
LEASAVEIKDLKHKLDHSSCHTILSPPSEMCVSLKSKLCYATKKNTELKQEVAYLTTRLENTKLSKKMIEDDLSRVEESATTSTYKLGVEFERCENKGEKSAPKFIPSFNYHKEEEALKPTKIHCPSNPKSSFNPKREVSKETPKSREKVFVCMFCGRAGHLDEFCFRCTRIEKGRLDYARNSHHDELLISCLFLILMLHLVLTLVLRITLLLVFYLISSMDLTIAHMVLVHERITLYLDALVTVHVLIMMIVSRICMVYLLKLLTLTLSPDTWMVHISPVVVHVPVGQVVRC